MANVTQTRSSTILCECHTYPSPKTASISYEKCLTEMLRSGSIYKVLQHMRGLQKIDLLINRQGEDARADIRLNTNSS